MFYFFSKVKCRLIPYTPSFLHAVLPCAYYRGLSLFLFPSVSRFSSFQELPSADWKALVPSHAPAHPQLSLHDFWTAPTWTLPPRRMTRTGGPIVNSFLFVTHPDPINIVLLFATANLSQNAFLPWVIWGVLWCRLTGAGSYGVRIVQTELFALDSFRLTYSNSTDWLQYGLNVSDKVRQS